MPDELFKYHKRILSILLTDERARDSDMYLYAKLVMGPPWNTNLDNLSARQLLAKMHRKELPHFESVRRTRQKLQEKNERVQGMKREKRKELEQQWRQQVRDGIPAR